MPQPGTYNGPTARICAELSRIAYLLPYEIRRRVPNIIPNAAIEMRTGVLGNSRVLFISGPDEVFVVFRGTVPSSLRSILPNLYIGRKRWGKGLVHRGFLALYRRAQPFITMHLQKYQDGTKDVYFAGHSQGGAIAYLGGMTFSFDHGLPDPGAVYTFGQPRTGNASFTRDAEKQLGRRYSRIANFRDIVVGVPFVWTGYDHSREYLHYGRNWRIVRNRQAAGQGWHFLSAGLGDHDMLQYLRRSHFNEKLPPV